MCWLDYFDCVTMQLLLNRQKEWESVNPGTWSGMDIYLDMSKPIEKIKIEDRETAVADVQKIGD